MGGEVKVFEFLRLAHLQFHVVNHHLSSVFSPSLAVCSKHTSTDY
jgi:hypothetical protein